MEKISEFIKNKGLFGGYPTQENVKILEELGVRYFVDLTCKGEKHIIPYITKYKYINYPIMDHSIPSNWRNFSKLIIKLSNIIMHISEGEKIYIHCKGGHGRSGIVVACILCNLYKISPYDAISKTTIYHNRRSGIRERWKKLGSPQTRLQKNFITKFFKPLYVYNTNSNYFYTGFNMKSEYSVKIPGFERFPTAQKAFEVLNNKKYKHLFSKKFPNKSDEENIMYIILLYKFEQNKDLCENLLNTGLRPIIICSSDINYENNIIGKIISKIREKLYI